MGEKLLGCHDWNGTGQKIVGVPRYDHASATSDGSSHPERIFKIVHSRLVRVERLRLTCYRNLRPRE